MRYSILLTTAQPHDRSEEEVFRYALEDVRHAEALGYDGVWLLEHHFTRYGICTSTLMMGAWVLAMTERMRVGTAITVIPLDHPVRTAEYVAMLDHLSGGRLDFGIGRGAYPREFEVFGTDMTKSDQTFREYMEVILALWDGDVAESGFINGVEVSPLKPRLRGGGRPPLFMPVLSPKSVEWAAKHRAALIMSYTHEDELNASLIEMYNDFADSFGFDGSKVQHAFTVMAHVDDDQRKAEEAVTEYYDWWNDEGDAAINKLPVRTKDFPNYSAHRLRWEERQLRNEPQELTNQKHIRLNPVGTVERCVDRMADIAERFKPAEFILCFEAARTRSAVTTSISRFADEVIPRLEERMAAGAQVAAGSPT